MAENTTYFSPTLNDSMLPTDGMTVVQPKEVLPANTITSPIIPDKDIFLFDQKSKVMSTDNPDQTISGTFKFGTGWLVIDSLNKRIIINDGKTDRILIGRY